jgi:hypothetical protein
MLTLLLDYAYVFELPVRFKLIFLSFYHQVLFGHLVAENVNRHLKARSSISSCDYMNFLYQRRFYISCQFEPNLSIFFMKY